MWTTCILFSKRCDRYYIGQTGDFKERIRQHMAGESRYTKKASDWVLVFAEDFHTLSDAMALERKIKRAKSRKSILRYIADKRNRISQATPLADIVNGA